MKEHSNCASIFPGIMVLRGFGLSSKYHAANTNDWGCGVGSWCHVVMAPGLTEYQSASQSGNAGSWMGLAWLGFVAGNFSWLMWETSETGARLRGMLK